MLNIVSRLGTIIPEHVHICFKSWKLFFGLKIPCWKNSSLLLASFALRTYTVHEYVIATVWLSCHEPCLVCTGIAKISRIVLQYLSPTPCKYKSISVFFLGTVKKQNKKQLGVCVEKWSILCAILAGSHLTWKYLAHWHLTTNVPVGICELRLPFSTLECRKLCCIISLHIWKLILTVLWQKRREKKIFLFLSFDRYLLP